jgi:hypothetical protein
VLLAIGGGGGPGRGRASRGNGFTGRRQAHFAF